MGGGTTPQTDPVCPLEVVLDSGLLLEEQMAAVAERKLKPLLDSTLNQCPSWHLSSWFISDTFGKTRSGDFCLVYSYMGCPSSIPNLAAYSKKELRNIVIYCRESTKQAAGRRAPQVSPFAGRVTGMGCRSRRAALPERRPLAGGQAAAAHPGSPGSSLAIGLSAPLKQPERESRLKRLLRLSRFAFFCAEGQIPSRPSSLEAKRP